MNFDDETAQELAKCMVLRCFRNGAIEDLHAGKSPHTETGDYSDVTVATPAGELAWQDTSKISDEQMREIMKEATNKLYSFLMNMHDEAFLEKSLNFSKRYTVKWDAPEKIDNF